jgi:hypothetical protein
LRDVIAGQRAGIAGRRRPVVAPDIKPQKAGRAEDGDDPPVAMVAMVAPERIGKSCQDVAKKNSLDILHINADL